MANEFRNLDDLIGLSQIADIAPPVLGRQRPARTAPASAGTAENHRVATPAPATGGTPLSSLISLPETAGPTVRRSAIPRPATAGRPTSNVRPRVADRTTAMTPGVARPTVARPAFGIARDANRRPLLRAISSDSVARRQAEPLSAVVTLVAWLLMVLAVANAWILFTTRGQLAERLPFSGYVDYLPVVLSGITWGGHVLVPAWLSALSALGLAAAAIRTAGLRRIGSISGPLLFCALLAALMGIAGTLIGIAIVAIATAIGVAIVLVIAALIIIACFMVIGALLSG